GPAGDFQVVVVGGDEEDWHGPAAQGGQLRRGSLAGAVVVVAHQVNELADAALVGPARRVLADERQQSRAGGVDARLAQGAVVLLQDLVRRRGGPPQAGQGEQARQGEPTIASHDRSSSRSRANPSMDRPGSRRSMSATPARVN